jgi:hypothetical protein
VLAVILPQSKKAPFQWIENLSMSDSAISQSLRPLPKLLTTLWFVTGGIWGSSRSIDDRDTQDLAHIPSPQRI